MAPQGRPLGGGEWESHSAVLTPRAPPPAALSNGSAEITSSLLLRVFKEHCSPLSEGIGQTAKPIVFEWDVLGSTGTCSEFLVPFLTRKL